MERLFAAALLCSFTQVACTPSSPSQAEAQATHSSSNLQHPRVRSEKTRVAAKPTDHQAQPTSHGESVNVSSHEPAVQQVIATNQTCNKVLSEQALCDCLTKRSEESELGQCEMQTFATPEFATMRTPGGDTYAIAFYRKGWYELSRLHRAGMEDFAVRKARVEKVGDKRMVRIVTYTQIGESEWMHTGNELVLCTLTKPWMANGGCSHYPLYAHTRDMLDSVNVAEPGLLAQAPLSDEANERESRFRVQLAEEGAEVSTRGGPLEHPELFAALGSHQLGE